MSSSSSRFVVEYAKSARSTCDTCKTLIALKSPRLGLVTRNRDRGFNQTKWHHIHCPLLVSPPSAELISGFDALQSSDQEALKAILKENTESGEKKRKPDENEAEKRGTKSPKVSPDKGKQIVGFSLSEVNGVYKDAVLPNGWKSFETIIFNELDSDLHCSGKIAAFDFDGCLANTSVRVIGADAWSLMYPSIPQKLQSLYDDGFKLVIFTNEANIERWKNKRQEAVDSKVGRLKSFINLVNLPIQVFVACGRTIGKTDDPYRKPNIGMWRIMENYFNSNISVDMNSSFFVGDAAGRKSDHSDADFEFAKRIGLKFHVPEEIF